MQIAVISDIHSNIFALVAVIADIKKRGIDIIVNLGDILYGPIAPRKTYELLMEHDIVTIRGNQDRQIYTATTEAIQLNPTLEFIYQELDSSALNWMRGLPFDWQLNDDVYLCHGTPNDDLTYLLENIECGFAQLRCDKDITALLGEQKSNLILCGHSHTPRSVKTSSNQLIVNPGSVGLPAYTDQDPILHSIQNFTHHASYAIVLGSQSKWMVEHIKVDYPFEKAVKKATSLGRGDWAHFLSTGRKL